MKLNFDINKPADFIFNYLTDMQKYASVHPVIKKIEHVEGNKYKVFETLKFLFIPFSFTYFASVETEGNRKVILKAVVMKSTKIDMVFHLTEKGSTCLVEEEITFQSKLPIKSIMCKIFKKQHQQIFKNIENLK